MKAQTPPIYSPALRIASVNHQDATVITPQVIHLEVKKKKSQDPLETSALASEPTAWDEAWFHHYE